MRIALTRSVSPAIARCELTHVERAPIDFEAAVAQHRAYEGLLAQLGCRVETLPAEPELPDSVFVEDAALVFDELAVLTRPGATSRRAEVDSIGAALSAHRECLRIEAPGTLDGGDVLTVGRRVYVGLSSRSNAAGVEQLARHLAPFGYAVEAIETRGCLHLKSAVTTVGPETLLVNSAWIDPSALGTHERVEVDPTEPFGANALLVGTAVVHAAHFPRTRERLQERGIDVRSVPADELAKAEGGVTCCSLIFESD